MKQRKRLTFIVFLIFEEFETKFNEFAQRKGGFVRDEAVAVFACAQEVGDD